MIVVADATPLHYLALIASTPILPVLFGHILIPHAVAEELQHPQTPAEVRAWLASPPPWLEIRHVGHAPATTLAHLDPGEQEAILLAQELQADLLLMDDWQGRQEAHRRALIVTGTLGVLERAAEQELLDLPTALTRLQATNFYLPAPLVRDLLARDAARKRQA
jgi:predicted nucleic acid-binding protein